MTERTPRKAQIKLFPMLTMHCTYPSSFSLSYPSSFISLSFAILLHSKIALNNVIYDNWACCILHFASWLHVSCIMLHVAFVR